MSELRIMTEASVAALVIACVSLVASCGESSCPELARCDVRQQDCQQQIIEAVSCMRGGSSAPLSVSVLREDELLARFASEPVTAEEELRFARTSQGLAHFGLAPHGYSIEAVRRDWVREVGALYVYERKEIVIVDRGESLASEEVVGVFAHEVVHALQDAAHDLRAFKKKWSGSFDQSLAVDALVEGEAVHYQLLARLALAHVGADEYDWEAFYRRWRSNVLQQAERDPAPVALADMRFSYAFGGGYVTQHWLANGRAGIAALYEQPPRSTHEMMFPRHEGEQASEQAQLLARAVPDLGEFYEEVSSATLGAWITRIFAAKWAVPTPERLRPAEALTGDLFSVQHDTVSSRVVAAWRARSRPSYSPALWPGLGVAPLSGFVEPAQPEVVLVGGLGPHRDPRTLSFRAARMGDAPTTADAATLRALRPMAALGVGCSRSPLPRWSSLDDDVH